MKKFLALGYMLALPLVSGAKILPSVIVRSSCSVLRGDSRYFRGSGSHGGCCHSATSSRAFSRRGEV
jgi:hypothetical protein